MSLKGTTVGAIGFSALTLIVCLYSILQICNDMRDVRTELDNEMLSFKVCHDFVLLSFLMERKNWNLTQYLIEIVAKLNKDFLAVGQNGQVVAKTSVGSVESICNET